MGADAILWLEPTTYTLQDASGANGNGTVAPLNGKYGSLTLQVVGAGWTGTINFEGTQDGTNYIAVPCINRNTLAKVTTTTADGIFIANVQGYTKFRARQSGFGAGTVTVTGTATALPPAGEPADVELAAGAAAIGTVSVTSISAGTNNIGDVDVASIAAGTNLIGKVGIDQVTANANEVVIKSRLGPNEWTATATSSANSAATATKALEASKIHIITGYLVVIRAAAAGADISVAVKDGTTVKIQDYIGNSSPSGTRVGMTGLHIACTTATAANLVVGAGGTSVISEVALMGYTIDA